MDADWDPLDLECMKNVPEGTLIDWKLCWRNPQPCWSSKQGRIIQIGDASHSFIPSSGNGAVMAIEDGLSLAECLRLGRKEGISKAVKAHEKLR